MDADKIGQVFAKTMELRSKITNCIGKTISNVSKEEAKRQSAVSDAENEEDDGECDEAESLLNIRDALESLEGRLSALQALQQQQWYEKEAALTEIEYSQKKLLKELKEYKGKELEVIQEAIAFASETEDNNDLLLPPYPSRPFHSIDLDNDYHPSTAKFSQNEAIVGSSKSTINNTNQKQFESRNPIKGVKFLMCSAAKTALTIAGVIAILSLTGFEPTLRKRDGQFKLLDLFQLQKNDDVGTAVECPPGKIPVIENGEMRCVVKERVEIPFESAVATPDVNYGCG